MIRIPYMSDENSEKIVQIYNRFGGEEFGYDAVRDLYPKHQTLITLRTYGILQRVTRSYLGQPGTPMDNKESVCQSSYTYMQSIRQTSGRNQMPGGMRMSKYHNKSCTVDNIRFASMAEARRYQELKALKLAHKIKDFVLQPPYVLQEPFRKCPVCLHVQKHIPGSQKKKDVLCESCGMRTKVIEGIQYFGDFLVINNDGTETLEDVKGTKGFMDPVFKLKHKLFEARYPDKTINIVIMGGKRK